jgi:replicative DNA helicase
VKPHLALLDDDDFDPPLTAAELDQPDPDASLEDHRRAHITAAKARMDEDTSGAPTFGFPDLVHATGPMLPGQLWTVLARPENGKTTFCMNAGVKWVQQRHGFLYFGTEEAPEAAALRYAAITTGNHPGHVVAGEWHRIGGEDAKREVSAALDRLHQSRVYFADETRPNLKDVEKAAQQAVIRGVPILVLDHFHRMALPDAPNMTATKAETVRRIKQLAVATKLVIVMAAQARRGEGAIAKFLPPTAESGMDTSALEQEADVMLGLFRPFRIGVTAKDEEAVKRGEKADTDILRPHTMGVKVLKHRRNGDLSGRIVHLHCADGMLANLIHEAN